MRKPTSTNPRSAETSEKIDHCLGHLEMVYYMNFFGGLWFYGVLGTLLALLPSGQPWGKCATPAGSMTS